VNDRDYDYAVRSIPHLNLTNYIPKVPVLDLIKEFELEKQNVSSFEYGINTDENPELIKIVDYLKKSWQGFGIVDITDKGNHMIDYLTDDNNHNRVKELGILTDSQGYGIYKPTDIGRRMAKTIEYIYSIFNYVGRVRLSILKSNSVIGYHNHEVKSLIDRTKIKKPLIAPNVNRSTIHIPLIENKMSNHCVTKGHARDYTESDRFTLKDNAIEYQQHYAVGEVWLFNSVHYHKAENLGNSDRIHILCYFDHMDMKIRPIIESAINDYKGPWID
jgi:hypothetical protein